MSDRIRFITHQGKQILLVDLSNCPTAEVERIIRAVPGVVTTRPCASALILSDFTGASFDEEAIRAMKESAIFDKPLCQEIRMGGRSENFPELFSESLGNFSRCKFPAFRTREQGLAWLTKD